MRLPSALALLALSAPAGAVAPLEALPAGTATVHDTLPIGAPQLRLDRDAGRQLRLADVPRLRDLEARWDRGPWAWRFDEATGRPVSVFLPGLPASDALALAEDLLTTLGPVQVEAVSDRRAGERRVWTWRQTHDGLPLYGTELALFSLSGRVQAARTHLVDPPSGSAPAGAELWWPLRLADAPGRGWVPATWHEADDIVTVRDLGGAVLARWTTRHPATVTHTYEPRRPGNTVVEGPLGDVSVEDETGLEVTDIDGLHSRVDPYSLTFSGERRVARDWRRGGATPSFTDLEGDVTLAFADDVDPAVADTWAHLEIVEQWLEDREPDHALLEVQVVDNVNINRACNAFYTGGTVNFFRKNWRCANTGRLADVIYHEYGHGVHHYGLLAGGFAGDLSEGTADFISATILDDPRIGLGFFGGSSVLRDIDPDRVYPDDFRGQVHNDGRIWSSFLWNLRAEWIDLYGEDAGKERIDRLMLDAMAQGPAMTTVGDATIIADDDDGDLTNGTPHGCNIVELLDQHGIGPGSIGVVRIEHEPLEQASSFDEGYPVDFTVADATPDCSGLDPDSIAVWWTTDPVTGADAADAFDLVAEEGGEDTEDTDDTDAPDLNGTGVVEHLSADGALWHRLPLDTDDGIAFTGTLPRQLATTTVHYFLEARSLDGTERVTTHGGFLDRVHRFRVGDREEVWCEDFEGDLDGWEDGPGTPWEPAQDGWVSEWEAGEPGDGFWLPDEPFEGSEIMATNLAGTYRNLNVQYLRSPVLEVPLEGRMPQISFRRWLTVEDAKYDKARLYLDDERIWQQPGTGGGGDHTLDRRWTLFEIDADDLAGEEVQLTWTLRSDPGLEYGGWALDHVCITRLADLPRHHRVVDLQATLTDDGVAELTWTSPWIEPLDEAVVVRKRGAAPTALRDGLWVHHALAPIAATPMQAVDAELEPCTTYHYAVLFAGDGVWYEAVVDGENTASVTTDCPTDPDPERPDPVDPTPDGARGEVGAWSLPPIEGCGCQAGPASAAWLALLGVPLLLLRRRRR